MKARVKATGEIVEVMYSHTANDMIAQAECYQEAIEYIKKAEVIGQEVDKWINENL